jgi:GGDEF domain-containing protein
MDVRRPTPPIVAALVCSTSLIVLLQFSLQNWYQLGIGYMYFAPILVGAILIGLRTAVTVALVATAAPAFWLMTTPNTPTIGHDLMPVTIRGVAYLAVAFAAGYYIAREHRMRMDLARIASTDALTGTANRRAFREALDQAVSRGEQFTLVAADVNGLKEINDTLGHLAGDNRILDLAAALRLALGEAPVIGRVGGDEFLAITAGTVDPEALAAIRPYGAVGTAVFPADGTVASALIEIADARLYANKRAASPQIESRAAA